MVTFGLVHGSQHGGWCWERLTSELERRGHRVVAPDLPCDDPRVGVNGYATVMIDALDGFDDVVLVGHSLGSLTIPVVASRRPVDRMIFLCSVPTGPGPAIDADLATMVTLAYLDAARVIDDQERESISDRDAVVVWYADCEPDDAAWAVARLRPQSRRPLTEPGPLTEWPPVPAELANLLDTVVR